MKRIQAQELIPCGCGCGETIERFVESVRYSKDRSKSWIVFARERRFKMGHAGKTEHARKRSSETHSGEKNVNWKDGISKQRDTLKASPEYKAWAFGVYQRDHFICRLCGNKTAHPEAHHIKPVRDYPDLVLDPDNGVTLCGPCHELTYGKEHEFEHLFAVQAENGVNSGDARPAKAEGYPEPSRSGNASEGATTRSRAYPVVDLESFKKQEVPCAQCGQILLRHRYRMKQKRHFCNSTCKGEWQWTGYKDQGSTKVEVPCGFCGATLHRQPHRVANYQVQYCNSQCMGKAWARRRWHGSNTPKSALPEREEIV